MERYFKIDKYNTFYDWDLILTSKSVTPPEPKTNYVDLDGADGTLDLSEALTGEVVYKDRTVSATFWTDHGTRAERTLLLSRIRQALHGKKVKIVEPDDPDHYFFGRVIIKDETNNRAYTTISIECPCEPWRYSLMDSVRSIAVSGSQVTNLVITNNGLKTLTPEITVTGSVNITYDGSTVSLVAGTYKISDLRLYQGVNVVGVSGEGSVSFTYKEADI